MARRKYENHVLRTYVDPNTGEVIKQDEFVKIVGNG
nr:MAG TPA: peptidase [Caudoviricetes sp.]